MSQSPQQNPRIRRPRAYVSILGTTQMHLRDPVIIGLWSAIFPGMGHLLLSKYISGMILFTWEVLINLMSHMNLSIFYTFTGQFELAKNVLDKQWLLLYVPTYLFAIWDSHRSAVDLNMQYVLAAREDAPLKPFTMNALGINQLDRISPFVAAVWSMISPGVGQLLLHRIVVAFFLLGWWIVVAIESKMLPAIHHTLIGQFDLAKEIANKQWILNIPSIFFFALYDAYTNAVESNNLFNWEQAKFLRSEYQSKNFKMPFHIREESERGMYIVSNFEHTIHLEAAVSTLQKQNIPKDSILAVPLDRQNDDRMLFDRMHASDKLSLIDLPVILAALFSLFGLIYGFLLYWGPVLWALIGTGLGFAVGLVIKLFMVKRNQKSKKTYKSTEVVLLVECRDIQSDMVQDILWRHGALGVSKLTLTSEV